MTTVAVSPGKLNLNVAEDGIVSNAIQNLEYRLENDNSNEYKKILENIENKIKVSADPILLRKYEKLQQSNNWLWLRNIFFYIMIWIALMQFKLKAGDK